MHRCSKCSCGFSGSIAVSIRVLIVTCLSLGLFLPASLVAQSSRDSQDSQTDKSRTDGRTRFESMKVKRIKPADLPSQEESAFPDVLKSTRVLPRPTTLEQLRSLSSKIEAHVVEVVVVLEPQSRMQRNPLVVRGHATWISAHSDGRDPVLVTNAHWLNNASEILLAPKTERDPSQQNRPTARRVSPQSVSLTGAADDILAKRDSLQVLVPQEIDIHRNLATLKASGDSTLSSPSKGLTFFDVEGQSPTNVFGFSPLVGPNALATQFFEVEADEALAFYLQTDFPGSIGAPIVTIDARLIALTAMRDPENPSRTLTIPPLALRRYVEKVQGLREAGLVENIDDADEGKDP